MDRVSGVILSAEYNNDGEYIFKHLRARCFCS